VINLDLEAYDLEINKIKKKIKSKKAKKVLLQLPDGLKPYASKIIEKIKTKNVEIFVWAGSCFGACDLPQVKVDLIVQLGHNAFKK